MRFVGRLGSLPFSLQLDSISAIFLIPVAVVTSCASIYGLDYWRTSAGAVRPAYLRFMFGLVSTGLVGVTLAADIYSFCIFWEIMALAAFFLIATDQEDESVCRASWIYLATTHISTLLLFVLFALMSSWTGSSQFDAFSHFQWSRDQADVIFLLALTAFGIKAGLFPGHYWLPPAHAAAPSHVSALMSGVLIKIGVYGVVRACVFVLSAVELWWGVVVLTLGAVSAILGVAFALGQHDIKRLLAYHSIENIGIIFSGLGIALIGVATAQPVLVALGMLGGLLHVWNHSLFKALLFLSAGSVVHAAHTREIDELGGVQRRMPFTSAAFLIGAVAICGLPPLNGFVSEFLIYQASFVGAAGGSARFVVLLAPALAFAGALAVACFVKVFGAVFLGSPRSAHVDSCHEAPRLMRWAMAALAVCCFGIGLLPQFVTPMFFPSIDLMLRSAGMNSIPKENLAPLPILSAVSVALLIAGAFFGYFWLKRPRERNVPTWDCGYAFPSATMQYTSSSFAEFLVRILSFVLRPIRNVPSIEGAFPKDAKFHSVIHDFVLERGINPVMRFGIAVATPLRVLQHGRTQAYILYILVALMLAHLFVLGS